MDRGKYWVGFGLCGIFYLVFLFCFDKDLKEFAGAALVFLAAMAGAEQWKDALRQKALDKVEQHLISTHKLIDALRHVASAFVEYRKEGIDDEIQASAYDRQMKLEHNAAVIDALYNSIYELDLYVPEELAQNTKELKKIFHEICGSHRTWLAMRSLKDNSPTFFSSFDKAFLQDEALNSKICRIEGQLITLKKKIREKYYTVAK